MRYAVLSDIHANLPALQTAIGLLQRKRIDVYLCLGDTVGYGPNPNECVDLISSLGGVSVVGNHDLIAVGALDDTRCGKLARETLQWTRRVLSAPASEYLAALPTTAVAAGVFLAHGSPIDPQEYVTSEHKAVALLDGLDRKHSDVKVLLLGHTHHAWAFSREEGTQLKRRPGTLSLLPKARYLINPGSVGQSRDRYVHARFLVLDTERWAADFYSVPYDHARCDADLQRACLPRGTYQMRPRIRDRVVVSMQRMRYLRP